MKKIMTLKQINKMKLVKMKLQNSKIKFYDKSHLIRITLFYLKMILIFKRIIMITFILSLRNKLKV